MLSVFTAAVLVGQPQGTGQPGEAELAHVASLHRAVYELQGLPSTPVPAAARELGLRYLDGRGVTSDRVQGCALIEISLWDSAIAPREDLAARAEAERLKKLHCSELSTSEEEEAWQLASCGIFGVTPQTITLQPGSWIDINRREMVLDTPAGRKKGTLGDYVGCGQQLALLRHVRIDPPVGLTRPPRHVLEVAEWTSSPSRTGSHRAVRWFLLDVTSAISVVGIVVLEEGPGSAWPQPPLPAGLQSGTTFTMLPSGTIRWEIAGQPGHHGEFNP
jgi:hypothetical protein